MSTFRYPSVFLSHGTPMLAFGEDVYQKMLETYALTLPKPKAVLFISAHSLSTDSVHILKTKKNRIIHDFTGFPPDLYKIQYECEGAPEISEKISELLIKDGFKTHFDTDEPLDHGIWIPMLHLYPKADVPVIRITLPVNFTPAQILKMGHSLASLREEGVMIIASGGAVHNLSELKWSHKTLEGAAWAKEFEDWLVFTLSSKNVDSIITAEEHPLFYQAHPSQEHFLPVIFAVGAALPGDELQILHRGVEYSSLSMLSFALNHAQTRPLH